MAKSDEGLRVRTVGSNPSNVEVTFNGDVVPASSVAISIDANGGRNASVYMGIQEVNILSNEVIWAGLDGIPSSVLKDELKKREEEE